MIRKNLLGVLLILMVNECRGVSEKWGGNGAIFQEVETQYGVVRGQLAEDGNYLAYLGIPYASPPIGKNRFKAPLPPQGWTGVYIANRTVKCPQIGEGDEDCLILNIFTPTKAINEPMPVLVYIHGGSFLSGSGQTKGVEPLIKQNIVVVTLNYRLGALGFLCLGIEEAPGNAGLKDQVAALKWIQENIFNFGGDPSQITIYGMSAGAASVELLVLSKLAKGLFQHAVVESAAATPVWTVDYDPIKTAENVADALNFKMETENLLKLVEHYQYVPAVYLSQVNYEYYNNLTDGTFGFVPCVEKEISGTIPFLNEPPLDILLQEKYDEVPIMFMFASSEGLYLKSSQYYQLNYRERMETSFVDFMPADLTFDNVEIKKEIAENVKDFYFSNKTIGDETITDYLNYFGDFLILHGLLNSAEIHAKHNNHVYLMEFAYKGELGNYDGFYETLKLSGHGDIVKYAILNKEPKEERDIMIVNRLSRLITNFAKYGNPTPDRTSLLPVLWPAVRPGNMSYLYMENDFLVREDPYWDRKVFWDQIYAKFRRPLKAVGTELI